MAANTHYQRLPSVEADDAAAGSSSSHHHHGAETVITAPAAPVVEVMDAVPLHTAGEAGEHSASSHPPSYAASAAPRGDDITAAAPPSYTASSSIMTEDADAKLPTYEEYEKLHENDDEFDTNLPEPYIMPAEFSTAPREGVPTVTVVEGAF